MWLTSLRTDFTTWLKVPIHTQMKNKQKAKRMKWLASWTPQGRLQERGVLAEREADQEETDNDDTQGRGMQVNAGIAGKRREGNQDLLQGKTQHPEPHGSAPPDRNHKPDHLRIPNQYGDSHPIEGHRQKKRCPPIVTPGDDCYVYQAMALVPTSLNTSKWLCFTKLHPT